MIYKLYTGTESLKFNKLVLRKKNNLYGNL